MSAATVELQRPGAEAFSCFFGLLGRDLYILAVGWREFVARTIIQPLMFLFVFTYVFPRIGHSISGPESERFATVLVPGLIGYAGFYAGIYTIGMSLSLELSYGQNGLDDRLLAPLRTRALAIEKALFGAIQAVIAGALVVAIAIALPASRPEWSLAPLWEIALAVGVFALLCAGTGLFVGTLVAPERLPMLFTTLLIPIAFLGCIYFSWQSLRAVRWLQWVVCANPLTYVNEALRSGLTSHSVHMESWASLGVGALFGVSLLSVGMVRFVQRVIP
jgi:ABC-2 type transport system permease protein